MPASTSTIETPRASSFRGTVSRPASEIVTTVRYVDWIHVSSSDSWKATVPPTTTATSAATAYATRRALTEWITQVVWTRGRRRPGAPAQHPSGPREPRGRLLQLREHQLLGLRVHAHVRAHRPRGRGRRRPGRRRGAREHVDPFHARAARRDAGLVVEVVVARGHPEPSGDARQRQLAAACLAVPERARKRNPLHDGRVVVDHQVRPERRVRLHEVVP